MTALLSAWTMHNVLSHNRKLRPCHSNRKELYQPDNFQVKQVSPWKVQWKPVISDDNVHAILCVKENL